MTANRWWVKSFARWQARIDASLQEINLGLRIITSGGIGSAALKYLGKGWMIVPFLIMLVGFIFLYAYAVFEGGVKNQVARDRADMLSDFSNPTMFMDDVLIGVSVFAAQHQRTPTEDEMEVIVQAVAEKWMEYRNGMPKEMLNDD